MQRTLEVHNQPYVAAQEEIGAVARRKELVSVGSRRHAPTKSRREVVGSSAKATAWRLKSLPQDYSEPDRCATVSQGNCQSGQRRAEATPRSSRMRASHECLPPVCIGDWCHQRNRQAQPQGCRGEPFGSWGRSCVKNRSSGNGQRMVQTPLITFSLGFEKLQEFVETTQEKFVDYERRISRLENGNEQLQAKNRELMSTLEQRDEDIKVLRNEVKEMSDQVVELGEQNNALREENALAFTKIFKKMESSSTSEGLQKEMISLKEGTDNRMLVLENLMREAGGDKMKQVLADVTKLQQDSSAVWKEIARMLLELENLTHVEQFQELEAFVRRNRTDIDAIQIFTSDAAVKQRKLELDTLQAKLEEALQTTETNGKLVRSCVERTDAALMQKSDSDKALETLRSDLRTQVLGPATLGPAEACAVCMRCLSCFSTKLTGRCG